MYWWRLLCYVFLYNNIFLVRGVAIVFGPKKLSSVFIGNHHLNRTSNCNSKCLNAEFNTSFCVGNDPVQLTNPRSEGLLLPLNQLTIETWVKINNSIVNSSFNFLSMYSGMNEKLNEPETGFRLGFHENFPVFGVALTQDVKSQNYNVTYTHANKAVSGPPLSLWRPDRWYHIAGVWDGKYKRLYIDGDLMESYEINLTSAGGGGGIFYGDSKLMIGGTFDCATTVYFTGALSEIRLWKTGRTYEQINMWKDKQINVTNETNLLGVWRQLNFGSVFDESGNQPPGISSGDVSNDMTVPFPPLPPSPPSPSPTPSSSSPSFSTLLWADKWQEAQRCITMPTNLCSSFISYPIYDLHPIANYSVAVGTFGTFLTLASVECQTPITRHLCMQYFPRCAYKETTWTPSWAGMNATLFPPPTYVLNMSVPLPVCEDTCINVLNECKNEIKIAQKTHLDYLMYDVVFNSGVVYTGHPCINVSKDNYHTFPPLSLTATDAPTSFVSNEPLVVYPSVNDTFHAFGGFRYDFSCEKDYANASLAENPTNLVVCEWPTVKRVGTEDDTLITSVAIYVSSNVTDLSSFLDSPSCVVRCPPPVFSLSSYLSLTWMSSIVSLLAFLVTLSCSIYLLSQPPQRKFPGLILTCVVMSVCGLSFGFLLSWFGNYTDYFCLDDLNINARQGDNALCDTQAIFIQFFGLNIVLYWGTMTFYLWRVFKMRVPKVEHGIFFLTIPACLSLISVIIVASTSSFGLSITGNMCWIQADNLIMSWCVFYIPVLLVSLFNIFTLVSYAVNKIDFSITDAAFNRMLKMVFVLLLVFACSLASQLHISVQYKTYTYNQDSVFKCHLFGAAYDMLLITGHSPSSDRVMKVKQGGQFDVLQTGMVDYSTCPTFQSGFNEGFLFFDQFLFHSLGLWVVIIFYSGLIQRIVTSSFHRLTSTGGAGVTADSSTHSHSSESERVSTRQGSSRNITVASTSSSHKKKKKKNHHHSSSSHGGGSIHGSTGGGESMHKSTNSMEMSSDPKVRAMVAHEFK